MKAPNFTIKQWAEEDKPREKLLLKGKSALSDAELIAILIGSGTTTMSAVDLSKLILSEVGNSLHELARLQVKDLQKFKGIGEAKAITIVSALELGRRRGLLEKPIKVKISTSEGAYQHMRPFLLDLDHEEFWIILLDRANQVIRTESISSGGVAGTYVDSRIIFKAALAHLASSVILVHNHPSGQLKPSQQDIQLTKKLAEAGRTLDIPIIDHLIFTDHSFFSFADESMI